MKQELLVPESPVLVIFRGALPVFCRVKTFVDDIAPPLILLGPRANVSRTASGNWTVPLGDTVKKATDTTNVAVGAALPPGPVAVMV